MPKMPASVRLVFVGIWVIFAASAAASPASPRERLQFPDTVKQSPYSTPAKVWKDFDPRREHMDVETTWAGTEAGIAYREFYFTGETAKGVPVRVYAMFGAPADAVKLPAVLHIHGGGQTASKLWLTFWAKRGYAAMSFNWGGRWENRTEFTRWGALKQGNHLDAIPGPVARPNQRTSSWYHWAVVSRRCLTYLERQPEVDPKRMGIFGISMGGTLVWPIAAFDKRVKAACAIYGNGWDTNPASKHEPDPAEADPDTQFWRKTMQGEAYAPYIRCPVLFLSSTNDHHGKMDRGYDTLARMRAENRQVFTPRYRHHIEPEQGTALPLWMDTWLRGAPKWPKSPSVKLLIGADGVPALVVVPDRAKEVTRVEVFYALQNTNPVSRFWRSAESHSSGTRYTASLPILDPNHRLYSFANVFYKSGLCLSSNLAEMVPAESGAARATDVPDLLIDGGSTDYADWYQTAAYTDPVDTFKYLRSALGPDGVKGFGLAPRLGQVIGISTHKVGDPKWRGPAGAKLTFQVLSMKPNVLEVACVERDFVVGMKTFKAQVSLTTAANWQTISLSHEQFSTESGEKLAGWSKVEKMELNSPRWDGEMPLFAMFRWER